MKINNNFYCKLWLLKLCMVWLFLLCVRFFLRSYFWRWIWFFLLLIRCQIRFDSYFHHDFISHTQNSSVFFSYLRGFDTAKRFMNWYSAACIDIDTYREAESEWCVDCECGPGWCVVYIFALSLLYLYMHMYTLPISICVANQLNLDTTPTVVAVVSMQTNSLQWHCCCRMDFFFFSFFWTAGAASGTGAIFVCAISSHNFFFARFLASIDAYMLETTSAAYECMFLFHLRCIYKSCVVCSLGVNARKDSGMINIVVWCVLYHCTNISLWNIQFIVRLLCVLAALCMPFLR